PKIDWSKINAFQDLKPFLARRDDNFFRIIGDEILKKQKKTLLIIGTGHLFGPGSLSARFGEAFQSMLAVVTPFTGYIEPESDAILYLGPPDTFTQSPIDPNIYLDPDYFKEESRRSQCCVPGGKPLNWDQILQQNSLIPKKLQGPR